MGFAATAARMWLTRSTRPFTFTNEYDQKLPYENTRALGIYIHIPFCRSICRFCPYCKELYDRKRCDDYIDALIKEIHLVGACGRGSEKKRCTSLYFGGGSPALAVRRIPEILAAVSEHFVVGDGIGAELHPEDVTVDTLEQLKAAGVTRISIGIQSFQQRQLKLLGRRESDFSAIGAALEQVAFETVSMDLIFALPGQTLSELQADTDEAFASGANHVAIYPFIDFSFADSGIPAMKKQEKRALLSGITEYLMEQGCRRESIWTFAKEAGARYSSMTRENFLGFGCSATTLLKDQFKVNTFSVDQYAERVNAGKLPTSLTIRFTKRQRMVYYLFWTAYSTRVDSRDFQSFFGEPLFRCYGFELWLAKRLGLIRERDGVYEMTLSGAFFYHHYENYYTLSYIDKMWGLMRKEPFPDRMEL